METQKSEVGSVVEFLGLLGSFPFEMSGPLSHIALHWSKIDRRSQITLDRLTEDQITHKNLERLIGELSYARTSFFGRFGRSLLKPLQGKLNDKPIDGESTDRENDILEWRGKSIGGPIPRIVYIKRLGRDVIIYAGSETSDRVMAARVLIPEPLESRKVSDELRSEISNPLLGDSTRGKHIFTRSKCSPLSPPF